MFHAKELKRLYSGRDVTNFNLDGLPENLKERVVEAFHLPRYAEIKEPIPEAYYFLCSLTLNNHTISVLTARAANLRNATLSSLASGFPNIRFRKIKFCNIHKEVKLGKDRPDKKEKLKELEPDIYFDDATEYCNMAAELGIETYLISNAYTGWNKSCDNLNKNIKVIKHVGQFDCRRVYGL